MDHRLIEGLMEAIAPLIKTYVDERIAKEVTPLHVRIKEYEAREPLKGEPGKDADPEMVASVVAAELAKALPAAVSAIPVPENGKDADPAVMAEMIAAEVAKIERPADGKDADPALVAEMVAAEVAKIERPADGKDADIEVVRAIIVEEVAKVAPKDGKDADPVIVEALVNARVDDQVRRAVAEIERPADGKSVTVDDVRPLIEEMVAALPPAAPGKDADPVEVAALILEDVAKLIPIPADGKSVTIEEVLPHLEKMVEGAVAAVPLLRDVDTEMLPDGKTVLFKFKRSDDTDEIHELAFNVRDGADGKSITVDDVVPVLQGMVDALPKAVDGKAADPVEVAALIIEDVAKLVPAGKDGKGVTVEELLPAVAAAVAKSVDALPKLPTSFMVDGEGALVALYSDGETKSVGKVRGADGARGASIMDGSVDDDGVLVLRMSDGRNIQVGNVRGSPGVAKDGEPGRPGRDAYEIQILPGIDESKSYVEGIVACWRGGLIRADRQTDPIVDGDIVSAGWKTCLRGIAEERESDIEDGRFIERTTVYTDGAEFTRRVKTATPIYQGVWKDGDYLKGDCVTWAGSSFIAQRDTSDKPETSDAWRLSVKRGRNGADGKMIAPRTGPVSLDDGGKR